MKGYKQLLLAASLVTLVFLLAAAARETLFVEWKGWQQAYRKALQELARTPAEREEAAAFEIKLRQLVLPQLGAVDRCVSCHPAVEDPRFAGRPLPLSAHSGEHLKNHPVERFGCTICHRGQGRAIVFAEAKAEGYHWDYPLLPKRFSEASCAACHDPIALLGRGGDKRAGGEKIFLREGCQGCHKLEGRGGAVGPALDNVGRKMTAQLPMAHLRGGKNLGVWLEEHFEDPQRVLPGSKMPRPPLNAAEREVLTLYMLSLDERALPAGYIPKDRYALLYRRTHPAAAKPDGPALYGTFCRACHGAEGHGRHIAELEATIPNISGPDFLAAAGDGYITETLARGRRGRPMPGWRQEGGLSEEEVKTLAQYLRNWEKKPLPLVTTGNAALGAEVYGRRCAVCHEAQEAPAVAPNLFRPNLRKFAGAAFIYQTLMRGRPDTAMAQFRDLSPAELGGVISYIMTAPSKMRASAEPSDVVSVSTAKKRAFPGKDPYDRYCAACHGSQGQGGYGPALAGAVFQATAGDAFLRAEVQACIESEGLPAPVNELAALVRDLGKTAPPRLRGVIGGDAAQGSKLFAARCSGCHGDKGQGGLGPALANQDFLQAATDGFIAASLVRGRSGTSMRAFGLQQSGFQALTGAEVRSLTAYIRSWQKERTVQAAVAK